MRNVKKALSRSVIASSIQGTTPYNGHRTRKTCGIFLPQIHSLGFQPMACALSLTEFAVQMISRNKAYLRTNKASRLYAVVESVSHPTKGGTLFTKTYKRNPTMKTSQKSTALLAVRSRTPIVFAPTMEVTYA
ncbi:TPA: hypothetical protein QB638_000546 [Pasteurella multocida]|nr:hypothetical protein [Pasteurella multocida]